MAGMNPIDLNEVLASFDAAWSPRIVTRVNNYDIRLARFDGEHVWHVHEDTDEFFLVLDGEIEIGLRDPDGAGGDAGPRPGVRGAEGHVPQAVVEERRERAAGRTGGHALGR